MIEVKPHPRHADVVVITADGGLNTETAFDFAARIDAIVAGARNVVLDCSHLGYLSSYGLGMMVMLHSKLAKAGGSLKIAHVKEPILKVMAITRVDRIFDIHPDVDSAAASFERG